MAAAAVQGAGDDGAAHRADQGRGRGVLRRAGRVHVGDLDGRMAGPGGSSCGPAVAATPGVCAAAVTTLANAAWSAGPLTAATSCSGPLKPGPKPWTSIS